MTTIGNIELPITQVKVLRNDDGGIIDLMADLRIPSLMQTVDYMVNTIKGPGALIIHSTLGAYVLFIYKPPSSWQGPESNFMAIVGPNINSLIDLMSEWYRREPDSVNRIVMGELLTLMYKRREHDEKKPEHIEP